ncbi:MAG: hypothetical protein ABS36_18935 [Acidobacteria bacterium SCN 69-37]|nr:MAG: hypothetical protein ABS36_18935 [Acidobacteria bacterium SCN 69-37]
MRTTCLVATLITAAVLISCSKSPVTPSGAATVTTPTPALPANGTSIPNASQPVTLSIENAFVTGAGDDVTYSFEVASDAAFASVVASKDVPQGAGRTSVVLDPLAPGRDYYWRVRTKSADTVGVFTQPAKFTIGAAVTLSAPALVSPAASDYVAPLGTFTVRNVDRSDAAAAITYRFEFSASQAFTTTLMSATVPEGAGETSITLSQSLPEDTTVYWRAQAIDTANSVTGPFSTVRQARTTVTIDLRTVDYQRFVNPSAWPETARIIEVDQDGLEGYMCINHTKRGIWPPAPFLGQEDVATEGTQWYFAYIGGKWYGGAGEWVRPNQICKDGQMSESIGPDGSWGGPMSDWVPKRGEFVGYMMSTPARTWPSGRTLDERSNVVVVPWKVGGINTPAGVR